MSTIGFFGLGVMGAPMAGHLLNAGHRLLTVRHRTPVPATLVAAGIEELAHADEVARLADIIITILPDTPQVEHVLFSPRGVAAGLTPGKLVIDMSSISPTATKGFARRIDERGCDYLDAPVSGGEVGAKSATLTIMAGGRAEAFARAEPLFAVLGKNITHVGGIGDGQIAKVANQIIVALTIEAVAEALTFARKAGADPARVHQALMGGFASSRILEVHGERMLDRRFEPGFRIRLHQKDLELALEAARQLGLSLPNTASTQQLFNLCAAQGGADWDHSALVRALELGAGMDFDGKRQGAAGS
ncbi:MAG: 2-hydroxy-3-oxopropionate reductase [Devosia sp.]